MIDPMAPTIDELDAMQSAPDEQSKALALAQQAGRCAAWVLNVEKQEVKWLPGGYEIFGMPFADFVGRIQPIELVLPADKPKVYSALAATLERGTPFIVEYRTQWPNGELHWQECRGIRDPECPGFIRGTTFDITDRKIAELGLLRIEKLAAVGKIASTIAHEINNPLASVTNLLYLALQDSALDQTVRSYLVTAQEELSRLANITRLTLSYARPHGEARPVDPIGAIENVLYLLRRRLEAKEIQVSIESQQFVEILVLEDELQRILTNLVANAVDAIQELGGALRISIRVAVHQVVMSVEDNGVGIAPEHHNRVFEPFFTTKDGVGTGIGLWVTKELVEKNGGSISFTSGTLDGGMSTRFEVIFPTI